MPLDSTSSGSTSSTQGLHLLIRRTLGPFSKDETLLSSHFQSALTLLSSSSSSNPRRSNQSELATLDKMVTHTTSMQSTQRSLRSKGTAWEKDTVWTKGQNRQALRKAGH